MSPCPQSSSSAPSNAMPVPPSTQPPAGPPNVCLSSGVSVQEKSFLATGRADSESATGGGGCGCGYGSMVCPSSGNAEISLQSLSAAPWAAGASAGIIGQSLSNSHRLGSAGTTDYKFPTGWNWISAPYFSEDSSGNGTVVLSACTSYKFLCSGGNYSPAFGALQTLKASTGVVTMTQTDGSQLVFNDFVQTTKPQGLLLKHIAPGGDTLEVTSYNSTYNQIGEARRSPDGGTTLDSFLYDYVSSGTNAGLLNTVTYRRSTNSGTSWSDIRRTAYSYYDGSDNNGSAGDLKTVETQIWDGSSWVTTETWYARYYKSGAANGFAHAAKYVLSPEAFRRCPSPLSASDATLAQYSDQYFEYSSRRVTKSVLNAGLLTYTFSYTDNTGETDDYNNWKRKTTITRPDGKTEIVYTNHIAQEIIRELRDGSDKWTEYRVYGTESGNKPGKLLEHWAPSAIASYVDNGGTNSKKIVVTATASGQGFIRLFDYATSTTATSGTAGDAKWYLKNAQIKNGNGGSAITLREFKYFKRTVSSLDIFPIGEQKVYPIAGGSAVTTTWAYTWQTSPDTFQPKEVTTTLPAIATAQNGSNSSNVRRALFDAKGNRTATQDERGYIDTFSYDAATGALVQVVRDAAAPSGSGWTAPGDTRLALTTDYENDSLGRQTQSLGPVHAIDLSGTSTNIRQAAWTVYKDTDQEIWSGQGYQKTSDSSYTLIDPVSIARFDDAGRTTEQISSKRTTGSGRLSASDTFVQTDWKRWSASIYNDQGQLTASRLYHSIPTSGSGTSPDNYVDTAYGYETGNMRRRNKVQSPSGTITRSVLDVRGNVVSTFVGTNDTDASDGDPTGGGATGNNMLQTQAFEYDGGAAGKDNNLTEQTSMVDSSSGNDRVTVFEYDWRNRQTVVDGEVNFYLVRTFDNLDRVTVVERKNTSSGGNLVAKQETKYDDLGRVYQSINYAVDPSTGTIGNSLTDNTWYDAAGNVVKQLPAGAKTFTKSVFDGAGRQTARYVGYYTGTEPESYADALAITSSNIIFEQSLTTIDAASNVIQTDNYQRFHDAPASGTGSGGALNGPSGSDPKARVSYVAIYPDGIGRAANVADYGTNSNSSFTRSATVPARSDDILVTTTEFNSAGEAYKTTDPAGKLNQQYFDNAGRRYQLRENVVGGGTDPDENRDTVWSYTVDGRIATVTVFNADTGDQETSYNYQVSVSGGSTINSNDLLHTETYPDGGVVTHEYNRQGQRIKTTDQNTNVRQFDYDKLGRPTQDRVTNVASGVDGAVQRIARTYEVRGLVEKITSYDNATVGSGNVVNEVQRAYNTFGQVASEYQEHGAAVNTGTSPKVQYAYADGSANTIRRTTVTYPDSSSSRSVTFDYGTSGGADDRLSRVSKLSFAGADRAAYTYLGAASPVQVDYVEPDVRWDLITGSGANPYAGLDRFGRVIDNLWYKYSSPTADVDRIKHGYDRASNRLWRENTVSKALGTPKYFDELYTYDGLNRLTNMKRGQLSGSPPSSVTNLAFQQDWGLDPTGNWGTFKEDSDGGGSWDINQTRTANEVNEITDITSTPTWADPVYDNNGNMTTLPQPAAPSSTYTAVYDAWNRLVKLSSGANTVQENAYDGLARRTIRKTYSPPGTLSETRHYFYSSQWQILEERVGSGTTFERQFVWGLRYIDDLVMRDVDLGGLISRLYALQDPNWNVTAVILPSASVSGRFAYSAYGTPTELNSSFVPTTLHLSNWETLFAGYRWDNATSLYCVRHRFLEPHLGDWTTRDPIGYRAGDRNLYCYCGCETTATVDPLGLLLGNLPKLPKIIPRSFPGLPTGAVIGGMFGGILLLEVTILVGEIDILLDPQAGLEFPDTVDIPTNPAPLPGHGPTKQYSSKSQIVVEEEPMEEPPTCATEYPGWVSCDRYPHANDKNALDDIKRKWGDQRCRKGTTEPAIACGAGGGVHITVNCPSAPGGLGGSILCCNCCHEDPFEYNPHEDTKCKTQ